MVYVISALGKAPFSAGDLVPLTVPTQVYREVLRGNFVGGATSFWDNVTTRDITISGIPAGATVVKALLFWGCECNSYFDLADINFNGTPITGTVVGSTASLCWGTNYYLNYMADVTSLVLGNGTYSITVPSALPTTPGADGATLYVVYCSPSASEPIRTISIYAGAELIYPPSSLSRTQTGFTATSSPINKDKAIKIGYDYLFKYDIYPKSNDYLGLYNFGNSIRHVIMFHIGAAWMGAEIVSVDAKNGKVYPVGSMYLMYYELEPYDVKSDDYQTLSEVKYVYIIGGIQTEDADFYFSSNGYVTSRISIGGDIEVDFKQSKKILKMYMYNKLDSNVKIHSIILLLYYDESELDENLKSEILSFIKNFIKN